MKIPENIQKLIKWETYPKQQIGGQTCGMISYGTTLICEEVGFSITIDNYRSQIKNKELALILFELYLQKIKVI